MSGWLVVQMKRGDQGEGGRRRRRTEPSEHSNNVVECGGMTNGVPDGGGWLGRWVVQCCCLSLSGRKETGWETVSFMNCEGLGAAAGPIAQGETPVRTGAAQLGAWAWSLCDMDKSGAAALHTNRSSVHSTSRRCRARAAISLDWC